MQSKLNIKEIIDKDDPALMDLVFLFDEMYDFMAEHGLMLDLAEQGADKWLSSISQGLGRFGILYACHSDHEMLGFAHGALRLTPDYLGSKKVGVITHVFVKKEIRKKGAGRMLIQALEQWFSEQKVDSVELQVLAQNKSAIKFWESSGYQKELLQYRKPGKADA
jgi:ribosomal protein S18 acetylase RimI-like enzyme